MGLTRGIDGLLSCSTGEIVSRKRSSEAATLRPVPCCCGNCDSEPDEEDESVEERERDLGSGMGEVGW